MQALPDCLHGSSARLRAVPGSRLPVKEGSGQLTIRKLASRFLFALHRP
jgi:hypothetical protein